MTCHSQHTDGYLFLHLLVTDHLLFSDLVIQNLSTSEALFLRAEWVKYFLRWILWTPKSKIEMRKKLYENLSES